MDSEQAFDQYHQAVYRFAYRLTRNAEVAEDVTQECFLALLRAPARFDEARGTMKTYLFSIARNLVLKDYRDHWRELPPEEEPVAASEALRSVDLSTAVAEAIAALPPLQQEALILFEYEGCTLEEISAIVKADAGTIKSRLHRARKALRRLLAPYRKEIHPHGTK